MFDRNKLMAVLRDQDVTVPELAANITVSRKQIDRILDGTTRKPQAATLEEIARGLGVTAASFSAPWDSPHDLAVAENRHDALLLVSSDDAAHRDLTVELVRDAVGDREDAEVRPSCFEDEGSVLEFALEHSLCVADLTHPSARVMLGVGVREQAGLPVVYVTADRAAIPSDLEERAVLNLPTAAAPEEARARFAEKLREAMLGRREGSKVVPLRRPTSAAIGGKA